MPEYTVQRLRGGYAIVWAGEDGKRKRVRLTATDRLGAEAEARHRWRGGDRSPWTVERLMLGYIDDREAAGIASSQRQKDAWKAMSGYWGNVMPEAIDERAARNYAATRRVSPATIRTELGQLAAEAERLAP